MTYYEWWRGDQYMGEVDEHERNRLYEADAWSRFVQLNNLE